MILLRCSEQCLACRECSDDLSIHHCGHLSQPLWFGSVLVGSTVYSIPSKFTSPVALFPSSPSHFQRRGLGVRQSSCSSQYQKGWGSWVLSWSPQHADGQVLGYAITCILSRENIPFVSLKVLLASAVEKHCWNNSACAYSQRARTTTLAAMRELNSSSHWGWGSRGLPVTQMGASLGI